MKCKKTFKVLGLWLILLLSILLSGCGATQTIVEETVNPNLTDDFVLSVLDVGDGAAQIIQVDGYTMVVDVGETTETEKVRDYLDSLNIDTIDVVIMSHGHSDHMGGYEALADYEIGTGYISPQIHDTQIYENAIDLLDEKCDAVIVPAVGDSFDLGNAKVQFLGPADDYYEDLNDSSLVVRITYGNTSFMLPGDMEGVAADQMISAFDSLATDVFVAAHHGSNNDATNSYTLLRAINPFAVIISSAGAESEYGFPHKEVLSRIDDIGATLYRTDLLGDIIVVSDGENITFNTKGIEPSGEHSEGEGLAGDVTYIGNVNSKKLHTPDCANLPKEENRVYFDSLDEALSAGYELCQSCN